MRNGGGHNNSANVHKLYKPSRASHSSPAFLSLSPHLGFHAKRQKGKKKGDVKAVETGKWKAEEEDESMVTK